MDLREDAIRLAKAATVRAEWRSNEVVLYDAHGKPFTYVTASVVKPMTYQGSARHNRALLLGGKPEPKRDSDTGLRCLQLSAAEVGLSWLDQDIESLAAGALRSEEDRTPQDREGERHEIEERLADLINNDPGLEAWQRDSLIKARRGQGKFRADVLTIEPACRITGITNPALLRASHIKPWAQCQTHAERLDKYNGLMLTPNADHLFDAGLITFEDSGAVRLSLHLPPADAERLCVATSPTITNPLLPRQRTYMAYHREHIFRR